MVVVMAVAGEREGEGAGWRAVPLQRQVIGTGAVKRRARVKGRQLVVINMNRDTDE